MRIPGTFTNYRETNPLDKGKRRSSLPDLSDISPAQQVESSVDPTDPDMSNRPSSSGGPNGPTESGFTPRQLADLADMNKQQLSQIVDMIRRATARSPTPPGG